MRAGPPGGCRDCGFVAGLRAFAVRGSWAVVDGDWVDCTTNRSLSLTPPGRQLIEGTASRQG